MVRSSFFRRYRKQLRDFVCSFVLCSALFAVMSPSDQFAPLPIISLFSGAAAVAAPLNSEAEILAAAGARAGQAGFTPKNAVEVLSKTNMPLISTVLALIFSAIMTLNISLLRHFRRVNASSRRSVWKEG